MKEKEKEKTGKTGGREIKKRWKKRIKTWIKSEKLRKRKNSRQEEKRGRQVRGKRAKGRREERKKIINKGLRKSQSLASITSFFFTKAQKCYAN